MHLTYVVAVLLGLIRLRSGHTWQLALKIQVTVLGERKSAVRKPKIVKLHCSCRMPEEKGAQWYHCHCMDIPSEVFGDLKVYLPAYSSHIVATSNHTRVCLHSRELLSFPTLRVVCIIMHCLCVPK